MADDDGISYALTFLAELGRLAGSDQTCSDSISAHWTKKDAERAHAAYDAIVKLRASEARSLRERLDALGLNAEEFYRTFAEATNA